MHLLEPKKLHEQWRNINYVLDNVIPLEFRTRSYVGSTGVIQLKDLDEDQLAGYDNLFSTQFLQFIDSANLGSRGVGISTKQKHKLYKRI